MKDRAKVHSLVGLLIFTVVMGIITSEPTKQLNLIYVKNRYKKFIHNINFSK